MYLLIRVYFLLEYILHTLRLSLTRKEPKMTDNLYPISVLDDEHDSKGRIRIHYIGYGHEFDEWREPTELVNVASPCVLSEKYDLHQDLALRIKSTLTASRKSNPCIKILMPFDELVFSEGLAAKGYIHSTTRRIAHYRITQYSDLNELLGEGWHFRGLNAIGDYCFVVPNTIEYYLCRRRPIVHFVPSSNGSPVQISTPQGFLLHLMFIRGDGTSSDFGKNRTIFT